MQKNKEAGDYKLDPPDDDWDECPYCAGVIDALDYEAGICPHCHASLDDGDVYRMCGVDQ